MGKQPTPASSKDGGCQQPSPLHNLVPWGPPSNNILPQSHRWDWTTEAIAGASQGGAGEAKHILLTFFPWPRAPCWAVTWVIPTEDKAEVSAGGSHPQGAPGPPLAAKGALWVEYHLTKRKDFACGGGAASGCTRGCLHTSPHPELGKVVLSLGRDIPWWDCECHLLRWGSQWPGAKAAKVFPD